jgi:hypothetical protein
LTDLNIKQALLVFDSTGTPTTIIIDGRAYTAFPSASYGGDFRVKGATVPVQIEIQTGDFSKGGTLPAYTTFHHRDGTRKSIASHT